jgi:hypothetical protein
MDRGGSRRGGGRPSVLTVETRHLVPMRRPCAVFGWMNGLDHGKEARRRAVEAGQQKRVPDKMRVWLISDFAG